MQPAAFSTAAKALDLPDNQRLSIEALIAGSTRGEAAHAGAVTMRTLQRWLKDPVFLAALHQARAEVWLETTGQLQAANARAVQALLEVLDCDQPRARVHAARTLLRLTAHAVEVESLFQRAALVEADLEARLAAEAAEDDKPTGGGSSSGSGSPSGPPPARISGIPPQHWGAWGATYAAHRRPAQPAEAGFPFSQGPASSGANAARGASLPAETPRAGNSPETRREATSRLLQPQCLNARTTERPGRSPLCRSFLLAERLLAQRSAALAAERRTA